MRAEYITKRSDYDLSTQEEVFYILSRKEYNSDIFTEKIRIPTELQLNREIPLDSKQYWRISPNKRA